MDTVFWDDRYAAIDYVYGRFPNTFVTEMAMSIPDGPVLCLAEGEAPNAVHLAELCHRVTPKATFIRVAARMAGP